MTLSRSPATNLGIQTGKAFCDKTGKPYTAETVWRWWGAVNDQLVKAGKLSQRLSLHKLRSTSITMWANEGKLSIFDVATLAGHRNVAVTQGYYLSSEDEHVKSLSTKMRHLIEKMDSPDSDDDQEDPEEDK